MQEPLRDGGSAGPARADPADGRGRGPAGKGKLPAVWGRAAAGGAFEPADLAGGADRSRAAGGRHAGAAGLAAGSADPVSRTRRGEIRRRAGPPSRRGSFNTEQPEHKEQLCLQQKLHSESQSTVHTGSAANLGQVRSVSSSHAHPLSELACIRLLFEP